MADSGQATSNGTGPTALAETLASGLNGPQGVVAGAFGQSAQIVRIDSGAIVKIVEGDGSEVLMDGLSSPTAIAFGQEGNAYITINGVGPPGSGEVVRVLALASSQ